MNYPMSLAIAMNLSQFTLLGLGIAYNDALVLFLSAGCGVIGVILLVLSILQKRGKK